MVRASFCAEQVFCLLARERILEKDMETTALLVLIIICELARRKSRDLMIACHASISAARACTWGGTMGVNGLRYLQLRQSGLGYGNSVLGTANHRQLMRENPSLPPESWWVRADDYRFKGLG